MPNYEVTFATFDEIKISDNEKRNGKLPYKYYVIANGDDGKQY